MIENDEQALAVLESVAVVAGDYLHNDYARDLREARDYLRRRLAAPASHDAQEVDERLTSMIEHGMSGVDWTPPVAPKPEAAGALAGEVETFDMRPVNTEHPWFEPIWQAIKGWDIARSSGAGYAGATGSDVQAIIDALSAAPAPAQQPAKVSTQWVSDQFGFLEGLVNGGTYDEIVSKAVELMTGAAQQPAVVGEWARHVEVLRTIGSMFAKLPPPCEEREAIAALTPAATPVPDGGGQAVGEVYALPTGEHRVELGKPYRDLPIGTKLYTHPPEQSRAVAGVPDGWKLVPFTGSWRQADERWEVYSPDGNGGAINASDVRDPVIAELLDSLAALTPPAADADGGAE
jgi:hypothetical protein